MGIFSKTIPARKWQNVSVALYTKMKNYRAEWYKSLVDHVQSLGLGLKSATLSAEIDERIAALQFAVAGTTIRDNAYVKLKDFDFFIGLICIAITSKRMDELSKMDFELLVEGDPKIAIQKWALSLMPLVASAERNQQLAEIISQWAALLVIQSKIQTCEACLDPKGADVVRRYFSSP